MAISIKKTNSLKTTMKTNHSESIEMSILDFVNHHELFIRDKQLENLSSRTIEDHRYLFSFFVNWIMQFHWSGQNHCEQDLSNQYVSKLFFNEYKEYLVFDKEYAPCTVNVLIRPLKAYINWLFKNDYLKTNYSHFIKLVKVHDDRVQPLSQKQVKKLLNAIGDSTYARFRDSIITITILDCGIRINELLQLTITDFNKKEGYIIVRSSTSKTRTERILPVSDYTIRLLGQLAEK